MTAAASMISTELVELFDCIPDYDMYDSSEKVRDKESDFRIALGRLAKHWGDQLLDVAEHPGSPLNAEQTQCIDGLLENISEVFQELNNFRHRNLKPQEKDRRLEMRMCDGIILSIVEGGQSTMDQLHPRDIAPSWLHNNTNNMSRKLRGLARELHARNRVLANDGRRHSNKQDGDSQHKDGGRL